MILPDYLTLLLLRPVVSPVSGACVNTYTLGFPLSPPPYEA
jgi:hypothetical protein